MKAFRFLCASLVIASLLTAASCNERPRESEDTSVTQTTASAKAVAATPSNHLITADEANTLISSYQKAVPDGKKYEVISADVLRQYLADPAVTSIAVYLAHEPGWAQSNYGQANAGKITYVVSTLNSEGKRLNNLEHWNPCPLPNNPCPQ